MDSLLWLIPALPLAGFLVNGLLRMPAGAAAVAGCAGPAAAFLLSAGAVRAWSAGGAAGVQTLFPWITAGGLTLPFGLRVDGLSAVMILVVTGVGLIIHVYSVGYMHGDPGFRRFFAYLNLFLACMLILVMADNLALMFLGWEGVGLCSYLLIGFWFKDLANADAGKKAFITNRVGDFGFLLGIFLLWQMFGTLDFEGMKRTGIAPESAAADLARWAAPLLFLGACGKSAQIPLHVWLPDAMAGPTPVSALIHAATMVTAGVYMVARMGFLYAAVPAATELIAAVAGLTALLAAVVAVAQTDIKKILAYSTISQLGFMFAGMASLQFGAGLFHVVTHAFFKALLFLGAGAVIHALHGEQDIRKMGGLARSMPWVAATFGAGALALAGVPPFAGFFSKDLILASVLHRGWVLEFILLALAAGLTAFYTGRLVLRVFLLKPEHPHGDLHRPGPAMMVPLVLLAILSTLGGLPPVEHAVASAAGGEVETGSCAGPAMLASLGATLAGLAAAVLAFVPGGERVRRFLEGPGRSLHGLVRNKFYVDEVYDLMIVRPLRAGAAVLWFFVDRVLIDTLLVHGTGRLALVLGGAFRRLSLGTINAGVGVFLTGVLAILAYLIWRFAT